MLFRSDDEKHLAYPKRVLEIIEGLDTNFSKKEVCVLVRTKKDGIAVSDYLIENNIPIVSSETLLLKNNDIVEFILNILIGIHFPANKEAVANALYFLSKNGDVHQFLVERINLSNNEIFKSLRQFGFKFDEKEFVSLPFYDAIEIGRAHV